MRRLAAGILLAVALPVSAGAEEDYPDRTMRRQLEVRDRVLLEHPWGRALTAAYYRYAPLAQLPLLGPEEKPQKLALLVLSDPADVSNLTTYLAEYGFRVDAAPEIPPDPVHELIVAPPVRLADAGDHPGRWVVPAGPGAELSLPFTRPQALREVLARRAAGPRPLEGIRFLVRAGSSPPLIAAGLAAAVALAALALWGAVRSIPARVVLGALLAAPVVLGLGALARDLGPAPSQVEPLRRLGGIRDWVDSNRGKPLPPPDLEWLAGLMDHRDPRLRREAAYAWALAALSCPGDMRRTDRLLRALDDRDAAEDPRQRQWAAVAAGWCGDPAAAPRLVDALGDPAPLVRHKAALALGRLRDRRAIVPLLRMSQEDEWYNALAARDALRRMGR